MKISKKQLKFISLVEKCGYLWANEIDHCEYPRSMLESLINKGLISQYKNKITSTTKV